MNGLKQDLTQETGVWDPCEVVTLVGFFSILVTKILLDLEKDFIAGMWVQTATLAISHCA